MNTKPTTRVLLEDIIETADDFAEAGTLVGQVADPRHPVLQGRARVTWREADGTACEEWLPCLQGLVVRTGDRVLVTRAANWPEPLVVGVVDGFAQRPEAPATAAASLQLRADETFVLTAENEQPLLEICQTAEGTRVRLLREDLDLELPGRLCLTARELELRAAAGTVTIAASDDVDVTGETINLN